MIFAILATILMLNTSGCDLKAETSPIEIEITIRTTNILGFPQEMPIVSVISVVNSVIVKNVIANNGNCRMTAHRQRQFPIKLKYGSRAIAGYTTDCNLLKVEVITDQGNWIFTKNR